MSKNVRFIILATIIAIVIAIILMPKKPAETPVTATPANGLTTDSAAPTETPPAPAAEVTAPAQTGADVDGVPTGTDATPDANENATTTPAPVETTAPAPAAPATGQ
jgi:hypothetical protein